MPRSVFLLWGFWCLPALKKTPTIKSVLSVGGKNPSPLFLSLSILPNPPSPPPPSPRRRDSNQTFHSVHLWNWKFPALNSPLWWQIKKSGFGGLTWNCRRYSVWFYTLMGQFWNSVVCGEESLLKPVVGWLIDWLIFPAETALEDLWSSCLGLAKWWHLQLSLDRFYLNNNNNNNNICMS